MPEIGGVLDNIEDTNKDYSSSVLTVLLLNPNCFSHALYDFKLNYGLIFSLQH
jgi:hypothetical protein